ncbi:hypothetical protein SAMN02745687_02118 [Lachnospiraceae bacterium NK3A20]|nr:hypothetical protein SAMN02745687_02118 [Lachnospiraceae bacterium NK3A20]
MSEVGIRIQLDPLRDDLIRREEKEVKKERRVLILGTDGQLRLCTMREAAEIIHALSENMGCLSLGSTNLAVIYNKEKRFVAQGDTYFAGSMLVMKEKDNHLEGLTEEEMLRAQDLIDARMTKICAGELNFSALEV